MELPIPKGPTVEASEKYPITGIFRGIHCLKSRSGLPFREIHRSADQINPKEQINAKATNAV